MRDGLPLHVHHRPRRSVSDPRHRRPGDVRVCNRKKREMGGDSVGNHCGVSVIRMDCASFAQDMSLLALVCPPGGNALLVVPAVAADISTGSSCLTWALYHLYSNCIYRRV